MPTTTTFANELKATNYASSPKSGSGYAATDLIQLYANDGTPNGKISRTDLMSCVKDSLGSLLNAAGADQSTSAAKVPTINSSGVLGSSTIANLASVLGAVTPKGRPQNFDQNNCEDGYYHFSDTLASTYNFPVAEDCVFVQVSGLKNAQRTQMLFYEFGGGAYYKTVWAGVTATTKPWIRMDNFGCNSLEELANGLGVPKSSDELLVDLGLPSGTLWATRNIDVTRQNGFAESPFQYECSFFSWGNTEGKNPISNSAFDYNWGSAYANTPGAALTGDAGLGYDAARTNLGGPWRMPTTANFAELFNSSYTKYVDANGDEVTGTNKLVTVNGVVGIRLMSLVNGKTIFFPCSGNGDGTSRNNRGTSGYYWSSSLNSATRGWDLNFYSGGVSPQFDNNRSYGFAVRPVQVP